MWEKARDFFEEYCKKYEIKKEDDMKNTISHKYYHTYRVVHKMEQIISNFDTIDRDLSLTLAIFHDLGRFLQYDLEKDYNDKTSILDHGLESVKILIKSNWFLKNNISKEK